MRGKNYSPEGVKHLLKIVNTILPISDTEWERVAELYNERRATFENFHTKEVQRTITE